MTKKAAGIRHHVTIEQILEWEGVPVEERLRWLEETNRFLHDVQDPETRECWEAFRRGDL
jgi:hypothetical protein